MNVERIRQLADIIEKQPHTSRLATNGFCMSHFEHLCGTPSCIAGWANSLFGRGIMDASDEAASYLEIDYDEGAELFYPPIPSESWNEITPAHAAATLRHLADTGKVDWSVGAPVEA